MQRKWRRQARTRAIAVEVPALKRNEAEARGGSGRQLSPASSPLCRPTSSSVFSVQAHRAEKDMWGEVHQAADL